MIMIPTIHRHPRRRGRLVLLLLSSLFLPAITYTAHSIQCDETRDDCEERVFPGSECRNGICSNPFEKGCLYTLLNTYNESALDRDGDSDYKWKRLLQKLKTNKRVCNSDDPSNATYCDHPTQRSQYEHFHYTEVRIHSQNWESAFFNAWILQILLSEVLSVPATIETGVAFVNNSFYDPTNALGYGRQDHWQTLNNADRAPEGDCRNLERYIYKKSKKKYFYQSCAHVIPEYWSDGSASNFFNQTHGMKYMEELGIIERPQALGAVGTQGLYVTKFTAQEDATITSYLGLQGEANREKLAQLFKRPTTWKEYCDQISSSSCLLPDDTAHRPPHNEQEERRFHVPGLYSGYFRATPDNDCEANPTNCTGHVGDFPCDWGSLLQAWIHHLDLPLSSDGRSGQYSYNSDEITEMWDAANATQSNLMTLWYTPEGVHSKYMGTPSEMMRIAMPTPTQECMNYRFDLQSENLCLLQEAPIGHPKGACDYFPFSFEVIKSRSLRDTSHPEGVPEALHSPAYLAVSGYRISHLQLDQILQDWFQLSSSGYLADGWDPRLAACNWIHDNLEDILEDVVPDTYPRVLKQENIYELPLYRAALFLGSLATALTIVSGIFVWMRRETTVMKHAQVDFLMCLLYGVLLVSLAAVLTALKPTNATCVANVWLIEVGYTMELVPLIVKVTAINRLLSAAKKMRRVHINRKLLFAYVCFWALLTSVGMTIWTILDPPKPVESFFLTEEQNDQGETVVMVETHCSSNSAYWLFAAMGFHFLLLMWAAVLAFQTRKIPQKFNESKVLVAVIYSQCLVLAVRVALLVLPTDAINPVVDTGLTSVCLGMDSLLTLLIYFIPKLTLYHKAESSRKESQAQPKVYGWNNNTQTMFSQAGDGNSSDGQSSKSSNPNRRRVTISKEAHGVVTESRKHLEEEKNIATNLVSDLQTENALLKDENQVLQESNDTLEHRVEQLEKEVVALRQQQPPDEEEVTLRGRNSVLKSRVAELEEQVACLQEQVPPDEPEEEPSTFLDEGGGGSTQFFDPANSNNTNASLFSTR